MVSCVAIGIGEIESHSSVMSAHNPVITQTVFLVYNSPKKIASSHSIDSCYICEKDL